MSTEEMWHICLGLREQINPATSRELEGGRGMPDEKKEKLN
jgi:hypothetical protein